MGHFIPEGRLTGDCRAQSTLEWPHQPKPSAKAFAVFRRFMWHTICLETSHWQPPSKSMSISQPMGQWLHVDRHIIPSFSRLGQSVYCRKEETTMKFTGNGRNGIYRYEGNVEAMPLRAYTQSTASLWMATKSGRTRNLTLHEQTLSSQKSPGLSSPTPWINWSAQLREQVTDHFTMKSGS